jgi:hypothetical protein
MRFAAFVLAALMVLPACRGSIKVVPDPLKGAIVVLDDGSLHCPPPCALSDAQEGTVTTIEVPPVSLDEAQNLVALVVPSAPEERVPGQFLRKVSTRGAAVKTLTEGTTIYLDNIPEMVLGETPAEKTIIPEQPDGTKDKSSLIAVIFIALVAVVSNVATYLAAKRGKK